VASAVKLDKLSEFIMASRLFLKNPDMKFFYPNKIEAYSTEDLIRAINSKGTALVFIKTGLIRAVPDILWGQLYRSQKALVNLIKQFDFEIMRSDVWSDEKSVNIFIFELSSRFLPKSRRHIGPPIEKIEDCERFLRKHLNSPLTLSGPRIEDDRLIIEKKRRYVDVVDLLRDNLKNGGKNIGVANLVSQAFRDSLEILVNEEIGRFYSMNSGFASFLTRYLMGKLQWLP
jgi:tRNA nucleotidyltransferase (CCA-adding enzyme)